MPEGSKKRHKRTASENVLANNAFVASKSGGAAQLSDSEGEAAEIEYLGRMSAQKGKKAASARRSRITSNFDPARAKANAEEEDESDSAQTSPNSSKKQQKSRKSAGPRLSLGQPTTAETSSSNKQASSSKSKISSEPSIASAISGLSFNKPAASGSKPSLSKSQSQTQSQDEEQHKAGDKLAVPPSTGSGQVISARAQRRLAQGKDVIRREWWQSECGVSSTLVAALKRNQFSPLKPGSWKFWGSTKPIMHKHYRVLSFFNYEKLYPEMHNVFAVADRCEIRVFHIHPSLGLVLRHGLLDASHTKDNVKPPKRHERESFLALAWSYCFWPSNIKCLREAQGEDFKGIPLLLAAGNCGVVKVYNALTMQFVMALVGHGAPISSISVSPKHPWLLATASLDRSVRVWNLMQEESPCVALFAGIGGHVKEVLSCAWHPSRRLLATGGVDRRIKVWAVPDSVFEQEMPNSQQGYSTEEDSGSEQASKQRKSRRKPPVHVHNAIASSNIVHTDHTDQIEWLDEIRLITKARTGRTRLGKNKAGLCSEIIIWRYEMLKDLAQGDPLDNGLGVGLLGWVGSEGALTLLKRFVVPRQGYWGQTMAYDPKRSRIAMPFQGGIWEARLPEVPLKWGFPSYSKPFGQPELDRTASTEAWESITPVASELSNKLIFTLGYAPGGEYAVGGAEDGILTCWRREPGQPQLLIEGGRDVSMY